MDRYAIILAAGKGTRMKSSTYKVLHPVLGKPMISHIIANLNDLQLKEKIVVVSEDAFEVRELLKDEVEFVVQKEQLGTGHAVKMAKSLLENKKGVTLVLCGDTPLITSNTLKMLLEKHINSNADATILTTRYTNPFGYGRIVRDSNGDVIRIVEEKDATNEERMIKEINTGTYCFNNQVLFTALEEINNNNQQNEYYLTDVIKIIRNNDGKVSAFLTDDIEETIGINDRIALEKANQILRKRINENLMKNGVSIIDSNTTYISSDTFIGQDTVIYPGTILMGCNKIGKNCHIGPYTEIENSQIGDDVKIKHSVISDSIIGNNTKVGPFARFRNHVIIGDNVNIGNFVEVKNSTMGSNSKAAHLSYIGDSEIGNNVNLGCGVITVNYNGKEKNKTIIKDNAFIGCNSNLIAPVTIEDNAYIAAGSTINQNVPKDSLAIARSKQVNKIGYAKKYQK